MGGIDEWKTDKKTQKRTEGWEVRESKNERVMITAGRNRASEQVSNRPPIEVRLGNSEGFCFFFEIADDGGEETYPSVKQRFQDKRKPELDSNVQGEAKMEANDVNVGVGACVCVCRKKNKSKEDGMKHEVDNMQRTPRSPEVQKNGTSMTIYHG